MQIEDFFGQPLKLASDEFRSDFIPLDSGNYKVNIDSVEPRTFPGGKKISYAATIVDGKGINRKVWLDFTVEFPKNPQVVEIALREIIKFLIACDVYDPNATGHNIYAPVGKQPVVRVVYGDKTKYANYRFLTHGGEKLVLDNKYNAPPAHVLEEEQPAAPQQAAAPQPTGGMPWMGQDQQ